MMDVRPLHNEDDYNWAIGEVTRYFEAQPAIGTPESDRFEVLATLIREYEDAHFENSACRSSGGPGIRDSIHGKNSGWPQRTHRTESRV